jgi:hypothetical protein
MNEQIYTNNKLKYPLVREEYEIIDKVWNFYNDFNFMTITHHEYRSKVIKKIKNKYTQDMFYKYEKIIEKLYWNLKNLINEKKLSKKFEYNYYDYKELDKVYEKFYNDNNFRSYINKIITIDDETQKIYYKKNEGSYDIFEQNEINHLIGYIMSNRKVYEKIIENPNLIYKIEKKNLPKIYRQLDYGFPNFSLIKENTGSEKWRKNKIKYMYYDDTSENNWFKLLKL